MTTSDHIDAAIGVLTEASTRLALARDAAEPEPVPTLYGWILPADGWAALTNVEQGTRRPAQVIRVFPGRRVLADSLVHVNRAADLRPGVDVFWSCHLAGAGRRFSDAEVDAFAGAIRAAADRVPALYVAPDAEPDRTDRDYSADDYCGEFVRLAVAIGDHPNIVTAVNLTGYRFAERVGAYERALDAADMLAIDPYWKAQANAVQATKDDVTLAARFAADQGLRFGWGEAGAEAGTGQADRLRRMYAMAAQCGTETVPYFDAVGPFDCRMPPSLYPLYRELVP